MAYSTLVARIEAMKGETFGTTELSRVKHLVNERAWSAYRECAYWENMMVTEDRTIDNSGSQLAVPYVGYVSESTAGVHNDSADDADEFLRIFRNDPYAGTNAHQEYEFYSTGDGAVLASNEFGYGQSTAVSSVSVSGSTVTVTLTSTYRDVYAGGTFQLNDVATSLGDVNGTHTVATVDDGYYLTNATTRFTFTLAGITAGSPVVTGATALFPTAFCFYRKRLSTTTYGDGSGETTTVPSEWAQYIIHGVMADILRNDQNFEAAALEDRNAERKLQLELERIQRMRATQMIGKRIRTHGTDQGRFTSNY